MLNRMENTPFLERLSCILHVFVAKGYQGYKSNFGFRVPFDRETRQVSDQNPFLDSPKGTHPRWRISFHSWINLLKILTKRGGGRLGCSWSVAKSVTKHKALKSLSNLLAKMLSRVGHKKLQSTFLLVQMRRLPLKWLILRQNETQPTSLGLSSLPYWVFFTPIPRVSTDVRSGVRWGHNQIFWHR